MVAIQKAALKCWGSSKLLTVGPLAAPLSLTDSAAPAVAQFKSGRGTGKSSLASMKVAPAGMDAACGAGSLWPVRSIWAGEARSAAPGRNPDINTSPRADSKNTPNQTRLGEKFFIKLS